MSGSQSYAQPTLPDQKPSLPQSGAPQPVPAYAQKPKSRGGCVAVSVILLLVLAIGLGGYFLFHALTNKSTTNTTGTNSTPTTYTPTAAQGSSPTSQAHAVTTEQLNLQVTYASVALTIASVQKATSFPDDTSTTAGSAGIIRINFRENNSTSGNPDYIERDSMLLILPGNTTVQATNSLNGVSPDGGVNRLNWLDFTLDAQVPLNQLTLRIGTQTESQMDIPLQANANLSKYQDKTNNPNTPFKYGALNVTIKTATLSYSYNGHQATTGNRYVIVTLGLNNTSANNVDVYPSSTIRMQAGGNTVEPDNTYTVPYTVNASTTASGIVAFLVPDNTTSFTLVFLAQSSATPAIPQTTQTFQIQ